MQQLFLEIMITEAQCYTRVQNIYNPANFVKNLQPIAELLKTHSEKYSVLPDVIQIKAVTGMELNVIKDYTDDYQDWFLENFEQFTKKQELERAIIECSNLLDQGDYDPVEGLIKAAVQISLTKDMGTDYFENPHDRLKKIIDNNGQMSTGWPSLDNKLYGGVNRGELTILIGGSGAGKSLFLQNIALNMLELKQNCVYITLELSEELCSLRTDCMVVSQSSKDVFRNIDDIDTRIRMKNKSTGGYRLKYYPSQSTVNDIRSYIRELQIQTGFKPDAIFVDYIDLLQPATANVPLTDTFNKDKYVSEELRNLAKELDVFMFSASQMNRSSVDEVEFDHSHIAGGISKINTADNVLGIFVNKPMRERGEYQLQLMKTRSSAGVGSKVDLDFDSSSLRITDPLSNNGNSSLANKYRNNQPADDSLSRTQNSSIMDKIKPTSNVSSNASSSDSDDYPVISKVTTRKAPVDHMTGKLGGMLHKLDS